MAIATGPGQVEKRSDPPSFLLFNFDIDGDSLKHEHKAFLHLEVLPTLRAGGHTVSVIGLADRSGSSEHNQALSDKRVAKTVEFLRAALPTTGIVLKQASGFGEEVAAREGFKDGTSQERFRGVLVFLSAKPVISIPKTRVIEVTAKSFIALIGSNVGTMSGFADIAPLVGGILLTRQRALNALAAATDAAFNEDPRNTARDKHYRLFTRCTFNVIFQDQKILSVRTVVESDGGKEGPLQPPPLIVTPITVSPKGESFVTFSWEAKGRPHKAAEPSFDAIKHRTSVFIWHRIEGKIDVSSDTPVTTVSIDGSRFPSHRVFVDNVIVSTVDQGVFTNLWVPHPADRTKVR